MFERVVSRATYLSTAMFQEVTIILPSRPVHSRYRKPSSELYNCLLDMYKIWEIDLLQTEADGKFRPYRKYFIGFDVRLPQMVIIDSIDIFFW